MTGSLKTFFAQRWQGNVGWPTLFWRDLLLAGTSMNVLMTGTALVLLSRDVALPWVLMVHLLPLPYNLFIVSALWRLPQRPALVVGASVGWLLLFVLI